MRNKFLISALFVSALCTSANEDPILMTINNKNVKLSEFEYMYHKNNKQQIEKESLNDYIDRFVVYKMKVAAAEDAALDTTRAFINELNGHKNELMRPYLDNNKHSEPYAREAYERMKKNLDVSHIMLPLDPKSKTTIDSIRICLVGGEDFGTLARKYSTDRYSAEKGGELGGLWVGRYPYAFENVAYNTPVGQFSDVVETQFGYHIIKVNREYPTIGKYRVAHIVKFYPRNASESDKETIVKAMDSLYNVLNSGADFAKVALAESQDTRTAKNGGEIGWFGIDQLIKPLEEAVVKTPVGKISVPTKLEHGIHILKVIEQKPLEDYELLKEELYSTVNKDERGELIRQKRINDLKKDYSFRENKDFESTIKSLLGSNGYDSVFVDKAKKSDLDVFSYKGGTYTLSELSKKWSDKRKMNVADALIFIKNEKTKAVSETLLDYEKEDLVNKYPEYANLLNEYREGILLFEISNRNVWEKASSDKDGLEAYFKKNKSKYTNWKSPKFKGLIVYAINDSVENAVKDYMKSIGGDTIATALHKKFRRDIRIERHLTAKGENKFVDELIFGGVKAEKDKKYTKYFVLEGKIIEQPEEAADVRGLVTTDYQNQLEKNWVKELKSKYKVKINKKVLKLVKE